MKEVFARFEGEVPLNPGNSAGVELRVEDGGQVVIVSLDGELGQQLFVRIQSWDLSLQHPEIRKMRGCKVRVTVEIL